MSRKPPLPKPPKYLSAPTRRWWSAIVAEYAMEEHHLKLLTLAARAWDRAEEARAVLAEKGMSFEDRFGQPRVRPEVRIEQTSMIAFARLLRELSLDIESPREMSRPPHRPGTGR